MLDFEMRRPVTIDIAPCGSACHWCGKPARLQLMALGDRYHNDVEYFCQACAEDFARTVADTLSRVVTAEASSNTLL
jgi:hypothetical protein